MTLHNIDYVKLKQHVEVMINLLEFDSMRSSGKAKLNSQHLHSLYELKDRYETMIPKRPAAKKED